VGRTAAAVLSYSISEQLDATATGEVCAMDPIRRAGAAAVVCPSKAARVGAAVAALVAGPAFVLATGASAGAAAPTRGASPVSAAQTAPQEVTYYIVPPPVNGKYEFLFQIAEKTLRNGDRFPEIVALNKGRLQPDGQRLQDPNSIEPGWILQLPADASGPGVHVGPLPQVNTPASGGGTETSRQSGSAPSPSSDSGSEGLTWLVIGAAVAGLVAAAGLVRALARPKAPKRHKRSMGPQSRERPAPQQARPPAQAQAASSDTDADGLAEPAGSQEPPTPIGAHEAEPAAIVEYASFGDALIRVRIGAMPGAAPVTWRPTPHDVPDDGVAHVCLGASDKGFLFLDIGRAPGPIAVGGDPVVAARLIEAIVSDLHAALEPGHRSVTVVGDVATEMELGQVDQASTLRHIVPRGPAGPAAAPADGRSLALVICSLADARDDTALAWLTSDRNGRVVPIVLGGLADAPWSLIAIAERQDHDTADRPHRSRRFRSSRLPPARSEVVTGSVDL
jgi:hypothetical protein